MIEKIMAGAPMQEKFEQMLCRHNFTSKFTSNLIAKFGTRISRFPCRHVVYQSLEIPKSVCSEVSVKTATENTSRILGTATYKFKAMDAPTSRVIIIVSA